jgi:hypothetical protein
MQEELGQYFLCVRNVKKHSRAASTIANFGIELLPNRDSYTGTIAY